MGQTIEGKFGPLAGSVAIVASKFNRFISDRLVAGALDELDRLGVGRDKADVAWVPGSFEIPLVARTLADSGRYLAVVCLGAIIRGQTDHYSYIAAEAAKGVASVGMATGVPTIFGVITADTLEQAIDRAGGKAGNHGARAIESALEMVSVLGQVRAGGKGGKK